MATTEFLAYRVLYNIFTVRKSVWAHCNYTVFPYIRLYSSIICGYTVQHMYNIIYSFSRHSVQHVVATSGDIQELFVGWPWCSNWFGGWKSAFQ